MRIDCYNASECSIEQINCGDTFYLDGELWIKVAPLGVDLVAPLSDRCYIVSLSRGELRTIKYNAFVVLADTKVVANTREIGATSENEK